MNRIKSVFVSNPMIWVTAGIEAFFWMAIAASSYQTVYLKGLGMDATVIGYISALCSAVSIVATPVWGILCDKFRDTRRVTALCIVIGGVLWALIPFTSSWVLGPISFFLISIPFVSFFRAPGTTLMESVVLDTCARNNIVYSRIRIGGSLGYAVFSFILVRIIPKLGYVSIFYLYGLIMLPAVLLILLTGKGEAKGIAKPLSFREMQLGTLMSNPSFLCFTVFSFAITMSLTSSFTYIPYMLEAVGASESLMGLSVGLRALVEVPALLSAPFLCRRLSVRGTLLISAFVLTCEHLLYLVAGNLPFLLFLSVLHGFGEGLKIALLMYYVKALAPPHLQATAQAVNATIAGLATILGNAVAGHIISAFGVRGFYAFIGFVLIAGTLFWLISLRFTPRVDVKY